MNLPALAAEIVNSIEACPNESPINKANCVQHLIERELGLPKAIVHDYRADFLFPPAKDSLEEAAYEFANAKTEEYEQMWWRILQERAKRKGS